MVIVAAAVATPAFAQTGFGRSVAVGAEEVFVGEPGNSVPSGIVYVYRQKGGTWSEEAALTAADASDGDGFGTALATRGDELLVSAVTGARGVVYTFERDGRDWRQTGTVVAAAGATDERFGSSLLLVGNTLYVGATGAESNRGAVYVFERSWQRLA